MVGAVNLDTARAGLAHLSEGELLLALHGAEIMPRLTAKYKGHSTRVL